jgi:hypothetical protein
MDRDALSSRRADSVYEGFRGPQPGYGHGGPLVVGVREGEQKRTLVPIEPYPEFEWGYQGAGPKSLAHAILEDRLGFAPSSAACTAFTRDVVAKLGADFELPGTSVDDWIAAARLVEIALTSDAS